MPRVDGFEFLVRFAALRKETDAYQNCVVMRFSSSELPEEHERALAYDFVVDFVIKGKTNAEKLKEKIDKVL